MKKKIGTVIEEEILAEAKSRAAREHRPLSDLFQDALVVYLHGEGPHTDSERACNLFCSHRSGLGLDELDELLQEDVLSL